MPSHPNYFLHIGIIIEQEMIRPAMDKIVTLVLKVLQMYK